MNIFHSGHYIIEKTKPLLVNAKIFIIKIFTWKSICQKIFLLFSFNQSLEQFIFNNEKLTTAIHSKKNNK